MGRIRIDVLSNAHHSDSCISCFGHNNTDIKRNVDLKTIKIGRTTFVLCKECRDYLKRVL